MYLCLFYKSLSFLPFSFPTPPTATAPPQLTGSQLTARTLSLPVRSMRAH